MQCTSNFGYSTMHYHELFHLQKANSINHQFGAGQRDHFPFSLSFSIASSANKTNPNLPWLSTILTHYIDIDTSDHREHQSIYKKKLPYFFTP